MALFDHIFTNLSISDLDKDDLSLDLYDKASTYNYTPNICDLLFAATNECAVPGRAANTFHVFSCQF